MRSPGRGDRRPASVQEQLPLREIAGGVAWLRGGGARAVLEAGSIPFAFKPAREQEAILAGYRRFLNGLGYPIQVLVRILPADIEGYLAGLSGGRSAGAAVSRLALDHETFVRRIARERSLLDRRFFVVVPAGGSSPGGWRPWRGGAPRERGGDRARLRRALSFRCVEVTRGLGSFGVAARRLEGEELEELWRAALEGGGAAPGSEPVAAALARGRAGGEAPGA